MAVIQLRAPRLRSPAGVDDDARVERGVVDRRVEVRQLVKVHTAKFATISKAFTIGNRRAGTPSDSGSI
jgi:hypothetical protein